MQVSSVGPAQNSAFIWFTCTSPVFRMGDGRRQADEYDADYFGVQYVYKAGYDPDSYVRFIQRICTAPLSANGSDVLAFLHFPRPSERVKALRGEIADILPQRGKAIVSTSAFEEFKGHFRTWQTQHPETKQPVLRRANTDE